MSNWIDVSDRLPEPGQFVLIRHRYRLEEYGIPFAIGVRIRFHGSKEARWVWMGGKCVCKDGLTIDNPLEWVHTHTLAPGDRYVTHWMPLPEPPVEGNPRA